MATPTSESVWLTLAALPPKDVAAAAVRLLHEIGSGFDQEPADAVADALEAVSHSRSSELLAALNGDQPAIHYVRARLLAAWGAQSDARESIDACIAALPRANANVYALRARWRFRADDVEGAVRDIQQALYLFPEYAFYARTEKLVAKIAASKAWTPRRTCRLAVASSATTELLTPVLRAALLRDGINPKIYQCAYGTFRQEILDPSSGLYRFEPEFVLILVNDRDLGLPPDGGEDAAERMIGELRDLWRTLQARQPCHIIQTLFNRPRGGAWGMLEGVLPGGRQRVIEAANAKLAASLPAGVSLIAVESLPLSQGASLLHEESWHSAKLYPSTAALPVFADAVAAHVRSVLGLTSKVLVLDLDNTLWGGVVGEDGLGGIQIGPPGAHGEAYLDLQRYALELRSKGIVLAVCSKNNLEDAQAPFRSRDGMALTLEHFAAFVVNWEDKATNIAHLAEELSLGIDSLVFLDDNPFERALVRARHPQVIVPEVVGTPWSMIAALRRGMYFETVGVTREDLERNLSYQATGAIRRAQSAGGEPLEEFLQGLGMVCEHGTLDSETLSRVTQLVNKTNQFNLTTRRYNEEQLRRLAASPDWWCHWFRLSDRFGDHGLIGVIFARVEDKTWSIDTWLMSCRVLGRRLEDFMCSVLIDAAAAAGASRVRGEYLPTAKNAMVHDLYPRMRFEATSGPGRYVYQIGTSACLSAPWISPASSS